MRTALSTMVALLLAPGLALAQGGGTLNRFAASETPEDDFAVSRPVDTGHLSYGAQIHLDYANDPLVYEDELGDSDSESHHVVEHQLNLTLGVSLGLFDRVVVFGGLPVVAVMSGDPEADLQAAGITSPGGGSGVGDAYLGARARLLGNAPDTFALGAQLTVTLPTGGGELRGDDFLSFHPELLAELRLPADLRVDLALGARLRQDEQDPRSNLAFSDELTFGLGVAMGVWQSAVDERTRVEVHAQFHGASAFDRFFEREGTPFEMLAGGKLHHASGLVAGLAVGPGLTRGIGSPDVRVVAMAGYRGEVEVHVASDRDGDGLDDAEEQCPDEPEDGDGFEDEDGCPDPDNDGDGVLDGDDGCPLEAEDADGDRDEDGCPEDDRDDDGVLDADDQCLEEPEDRDEFQDEDGCPDPDNDGDGVPDGDDGCPLEVGPASNRGCPEPDRDGDSVVDRLDNCPDEPGSVENHGCAEQQQVVIQDGRLEILDIVYFRTNRDVIQSRSFGLLDNVARVLNAHPEIERVRVEGHTDSRGRREYNVDLSQRRAEAVVRYLVERAGVAAGRLEARGFGPDQPLVENASTEEEHARNRRVEFEIVGAGDGIEQRDTGPTEETIDR